MVICFVGCIAKNRIFEKLGKVKCLFFETSFGSL